MTKDVLPAITSEIVLYQPDESISLEVKLDQETVWLTQAQMVELFQTSKQNVSLHISNIFKEGELLQEMVVKESLTTTSHGAIPGKFQQKKVKLYNLDVIISVGYRVKSQRGTQFRIWATSVLRDYLLRGYAVNTQLLQMERRIDDRLLQQHNQIQEIRALQQKQQEQINFFIHTNQPPHEGVVFQGNLLEGREVAEALIRSAKREVILIDAYIGADTFHILEARNDSVRATIYTEKTDSNILTLQADHESEYGINRHIEVQRYRTDFHDRFLIIDDDVYHFGASLKDLGKRLFAFDLMGLSKTLIMSQVQ